MLSLTAVVRSWGTCCAWRSTWATPIYGWPVERSPRTRAAAQRIAAEHVVLADECIDGCREIPNIAARLMNALIWTFWRD